VKFYDFLLCLGSNVSISGNLPGFPWGARQFEEALRRVDGKVDRVAEVASQCSEGHMGSSKYGRIPPRKGWFDTRNELIIHIYIIYIYTIIYIYNIVFLSTGSAFCIHTGP
jgi:hypothetical protein